MYIPKHFQNTDNASILEFIRKYSFGTLITSQDNIPVATHLPFLVEERDGELILVSHLAKANPQEKQLPAGEALVIFTEPHAYISPKHYEKEQSVPTWNYIAVHAYGKATIIEAEDELLAMMEKMITQYDTAYLNQWNNLPAEFKTRMFKGIVAFEIKVTSLQAKNKLSQNRSETERKSIIESFEKSDDTNEVEIAKYMKKG
ncbi:FMN-binding negative transcriptional regulator [Mucilaginibacter sp. HMF5004]|uniref:FMN-binding negative transcriptional regulator n=1 Tax=Mucilaginibacter rivuli TaxID=2857527 RepID=UPI001C5DF9D2|nr:FMN-binding negative transcriptional regulator [Mucilaginibacter rivuli]MBW4889690.1 FMN-binding negative transcriptional regulator [Mucilaginibacter rivuli]